MRPFSTPGQLGKPQKSKAEIYLNLFPVVDMSKANCDIMRDWASAYRAAVRQRTVRQKTPMAKHGTQPEFIYQRHCIGSELTTY